MGRKGDGSNYGKGEREQARETEMGFLPSSEHKHAATLIDMHKNSIFETLLSLYMNSKSMGAVSSHSARR